MTAPDPEATRFAEQILLQARRVAATGTVTREMLNRTDAHAMRDFLRNQLVVSLETAVYGHHVLTQDIEVPTSGAVEVSDGDVPEWALVELPQSWWRRLFRRPPRRVWCPVVGGAVVAHAAGRMPVTGSATLPVKFVHTFPDARLMDYPEVLGKARNMHDIVVARPVVDWRFE